MVVHKSSKEPQTTTTTTSLTIAAPDAAAAAGTLSGLLQLMILDNDDNKDVTLKAFARQPRQVLPSLLELAVVGLSDDDDDDDDTTIASGTTGIYLQQLRAICDSKSPTPKLKPQLVQSTKHSLDR